MKLGLMGLKGHQSTVLAGAEELGDIQVVAISDDDPKTVDEYQKQKIAHGAQGFENWRDMLDHSSLDICCVCDENYLRADQVVALAERNIHIVAEKPLATTLEDLERIQAALAKSQSRLSMLLTMRHEPKYATLRELVQSGVIGEVCQATCQKSYQLHTRPQWFKERKRLGGIIPYIGIHATDMIRWVTGLEYTHVAAFHGRIGKPEIGETEDHASILLRLSNGASATARLDYLRPSKAPSHGDDRIRIAGTNGVVEVTYPDPAVRVVTESKAPYHVQPQPTPNLFVDFVQSIRENRPATITAEDSLTITRLVLQARKAADEQTLVQL